MLADSTTLDLKLVGSSIFLVGACQDGPRKITMGEGSTVVS